MADPDYKKLRRIAKGRFTRICNSIVAAIDQNKTIEYVHMLNADLKEAWKSVNDQHESVVLQSAKDEEENENWIGQLEKTYDEVREMILRHKTRINEQHIDSEAIDRRHLQEEEVQISAMRAKNVRSIQHDDFQQLCDQIIQLINKNSVEGVKAARADLVKLMEDVKTAHMQYVSMLPNEEAINENLWLQSVRDKYGETSSAVAIILEHLDKSKTQKTVDEKRKGGIQLEKMRLPTFDGDVRAYPRFKTDFLKFILPETTRDQAAFVLRKSLGEKPLQVVGAVDDDINEIWKRLDERYGDPIKLADAVMHDFESIDSLKDGDDKRFVEFVDIIERGHNDLRKLGMEKEMSNTRVVSDIERRLPPAIRREWSRSLYDEKAVIDRTDRFPALLKFLVREKKSVEYEVSGVRSKPSSRFTINTTNIEERNDAPKSENNKNCLVHDMGQHTTPECRAYIAMNLSDKTQLVRAKGACFGCLVRGHRIAECKNKRQCGVSECSRLHHSSLHDDTVGDNSQPKTTLNHHTGVATSKQTGACLLQLMSIKVGAGHMNVLFDGCATASLVTNKSARAAKLKGQPVKIAITKIGGLTEEIDSFHYIVPLIDKQGSVINISAYGIDQITSNIECIAVQHVVGLFSKVRFEEIKRPTGQVDLLVGYEYAGYHPIRMEAAEHLLLLENRFGKCLGGSHPTLKENTTTLVKTAALIHHVTTCSLDSFIKMAGMGVQCNPQCGSCRCGRCPVGAKEYTLKEERELALIEKNLKFCGSHWIAEYPWIKDPAELPNNRNAALFALKSLENRLKKDPEKAAAYNTKMKNMYKMKKIAGALNVLTANDINEAELLWIIECQKPIMDMLINNEKRFDDQYAKLSPRVQDDGAIVVGARAQRHINFSYNNQEVPLLTANHRFSKLYVTHAHNRSHCGVQSTVSLVRLRYWILNLQRLAKSVRHHCVPCRKREKDMSGQQMGQLPIERLKPSPPWSFIGVDLFGPFITRGEVNKRARGKAYGIIFTCLVTQAVYLDLATDYSTTGFLQAFRRFVSIRGYPTEIYNQLVSASKELKGVIDGGQESDLHDFGITKGTTWKFSAADSPWQNGVTEILIKGIKKGIHHAIGGQVLPFNELQTVLFEVANLVNKRPIGRHPTDPEDGAYLGPNTILLGRATTRVPSGPWRATNNPRNRIEFVQSLIKSFWVKWNRDYFPSLIVRQKWHHEKRNMQIGDVVLVQDSNTARGKWRMGLGSSVYPDINGKVRTVQVELRNEDRNAKQTVTRAVQRLIVLVAVDDIDE
ncbi:uncharacterized protein [Antedon mediterranea]|uniref:uncharacterized protein n=1 Tax=Antedon mediterranea TaxID=105859 RepID=UPI003AF9A807